ncbi:MAG TPA: sigma-70 family RNA polymerase sigma factor, partial [Pelomicrobium sp.]|nr:sigma-70 family RNA polymerase sigma factor [Pelomicrobium sp.]
MSAPAAVMPGAGADTPALENLEQYLPYLYRFALGQLRDPDLAQDAVQETLLAALKGGARFEGRSAVRSWLTAILKHKVVDIQRARARETPLESDVAADEADDDAFRADGHWQHPPADWGDPDRALEQQRFWETFQRCLDGLPERAARAFILREIEGEPIDEICRVLEISQS